MAIVGGIVVATILGTVCVFAVLNSDSDGNTVESWQDAEVFGEIDVDVMYSQEPTFGDDFEFWMDDIISIDKVNDNISVHPGVIISKYNDNMSGEYKIIDFNEEDKSGDGAYSAKLGENAIVTFIVSGGEMTNMSTIINQSDMEGNLVYASFASLFYATNPEITKTTLNKVLKEVYDSNEPNKVFMYEYAGRSTTVEKTLNDGNVSIKINIKIEKGE